MKCPACLTHVATSARSVPQHKRFFGVLRAMFYHWPQTHAFLPETEEHLRAWVLCKTGHFSVTTIDVPERATDTLIATIQAALKAAGSYAFVQPDNDQIKIFKPKSIAFHRLSAQQFNELNTKIEDLYRVETGLDPDQVLAEYERAA